MHSLSFGTLRTHYDRINLFHCLNFKLISKSNLVCILNNRSYTTYLIIYYKSVSKSFENSKNIWKLHFYHKLFISCMNMVHNNLDLKYNIHSTYSANTKIIIVLVKNQDFHFQSNYY